MPPRTIKESQYKPRTPDQLTPHLFRKMQVFLEARNRRGLSLAESIEIAGWKLQSYYAARARYPHFAKAIDGGFGNLRLDEARAVLPPPALMPAKPDVPDFVTWRKQVFDHDTAPHMHEIIRVLEDRSLKRVLILLPPGHAKTTIVSEWLVHRMCVESVKHSRKEPFTPMRAAYFSQESSFAKTVGWQMRQWMLDFDAYPLMGQWGPFRDVKTKWSDRAVYGWWRDGSEKEPSIQWKGWENQIQGARLTDVVLDDADSVKQAPTKRQMLLTVLDQTIARRVDDEGKVTVLGNLFPDADFYRELERRADLGFWEVIKLPAYDSQGKVLWDRWSMKFFEDTRAEMNNDPLFYSTYLQQESLGDSATFPLDLLNACRVPSLPLNEVYEGDNFVVAGIDPAQDGPYAACVVSYNRSTRTIRLLDMLSGDKGGNKEMKEAVRWCLKHRPHVLGIEKQGGMALFLDEELEQEISDNHTRLEQIPTTAQGMIDQFYGFSALALWMREGRVEFPGRGAATAITNPLIDEAAVWRPDPKYRGRKDRLMAFWFCFRLVLAEAPMGNVLPFGKARRYAPWLKQQQHSIPVASLLGE